MTSTVAIREALSLEILRASHDEKPVWEVGLEEITDRILAAFDVRLREQVADAPKRLDGGL